jgi:hypothetical protein
MEVQPASVAAFADFGGVRVHDGAQAESLGLTANGLELRVGHGLRAAFADAFGGE